MTPEQTEQLNSALKRGDAALNKNEHEFQAATLEILKLLAAETLLLRKEDERLERLL